MKRILICSLISLSLFGCGKTELTCEETGKTAIETIKERFIMAESGMNAVAIYKMAKNAPEVVALGKELPKPTWEVIFPSTTVEFKNAVVISRNSDTKKLQCKATLVSPALDIKSFIQKLDADRKAVDPNDKTLSIALMGAMFAVDNAADGASVEYSAQPTEDGKSISITLGSNNISNNTASTISNLALAIYADILEKFGKSQGAVDPKKSAASAPTPVTAASALPPASSPVVGAVAAAPPPPSSVASVPVAVAPTPVPAPKPEVDTSAFAPSFDCAKASTGPERLICSDRELSKLDVDLSQTYSKARETSADKNKLKSEQLEWFKRSRNACSDKSCMENAYKQRISDLGK